MKKFINKINSKATELAIRTKTALASKSGEGYIDTAVKIIIGVDCVMSIAEYVVVDCSSDPEDNILTETVLEKADIVIRLLSPDLKGISNYLSQTPIFIRMGYMKENCVQLISVTSPEFQYGAADTISYFGKVEQIIPYSQALKEQYVSGNLTEVTKDKKYAAVLEAVRQKVVK